MTPLLDVERPILAVGGTIPGGRRSQTVRSGEIEPNTSKQAFLPFSVPFVGVIRPARCSTLLLPPSTPPPQGTVPGTKISPHSYTLFRQVLCHGNNKRDQGSATVFRLAESGGPPASASPVPGLQVCSPHTAEDTV